MKKILYFFRKYYGSLIGAIIGAILVSLFYYLFKFQTGSLSPRMLYLSDLATFLVGPIMLLIVVAFAPLTIFLYFFPSVAIYIFAVIHIIFTIILYGALGFIVHYIVVKLVKSLSKVDKKEKI